MGKNRRQFIKASAAIGIAGISEASAKTRKSSRQSRIMSAHKIGFLHSTIIDLNHLGAFNIGLGSAVPTIYEHANSKYGAGHTELHDKATKHINKSVDLIVAAGGLVSAVATAQALADAKNNTIPFVCLIGRMPTAQEANSDPALKIFLDSKNRAGVVNQDVPSQNENNWKALQAKDATITADQVGLIVNNNATMSGPEVAMWTANHPSQMVAALSGENDTQLQVLFQSIAGMTKPKGFVVSSDPFFRSMGDQFDSKLRSDGQFTGWACYPYAEFVASSDQFLLSPNTSPLALPDDPTNSSAAYYRLGQMAAAVLQAGPRNLPKVLSKTWNGSHWV